MRFFQKITQNCVPARLLRGEDGATAIEYGLIAALVAVAAIAALQLVGTDLSTLFSNIATYI